MIKSIFRTLAFTSNWRALVWRQPSMLLSMIAGPFLVLFLFGIGNTIYEPRPKTIVVNQSQGSQSEFQVTPEDLSNYLEVVEVTSDGDHALAELRARRIRLIMVIPPNPEQIIQSGKRAIIRVFVNEIDPVSLAFAQIDVRAQMAVVNSKIGERQIESLKGPLGNLGGILNRAQPLLVAVGMPQSDINNARQSIDTIESVPSDVLASPVDATVENITPLEPTVITYFVPAAIALIIQHLAVTLAGLSMIRARLLGTTRLWQTAPIRLGEILAGNYISYAILIVVVSIVLVLALIWALGLPVLGSFTLLWTSILLLIFASLGYGFFISMVAKNEQTAAQMAMIILLASLFLGGFLRSLEAIIPPVRVVSYLLPATYEGQILQELMLRGGQGDVTHYLALAVIGVVGIVASFLLLGRELKPS